MNKNEELRRRKHIKFALAKANCHMKITFVVVAVASSVAFARSAFPAKKRI